VELGEGLSSGLIGGGGAGLKGSQPRRVGGGVYGGNAVVDRAAAWPSLCLWEP